INAHFHKTSTSDFLTDFTNNIMPTVTLTQSAIKCFRKKKQGKIITVLTAALINKPPIGSSVYIATKAYLQQLTKIWAVENAKFNITSNSVSPAFMRTAMTSHMDERVVEQIMENSPLGKLLTTEEVAESIFLLLNAPAQINGVNLIINGAANVL
ncbi:MAG TPA: SDR family oxidoreductase, partial [Puia sp.]|nr:SDR family oxidoreductase [Puia sp.]